MILETIHTRDDLLALTPEQDQQLCREIRTFLVENVSKTGGHLASNLGIVEATLAIHKVFDTSRDRLVFDVGHQCYVHKLLTGRTDQFHTLRQLDGIAGFPKPSESIHDAFVAGHASNAVSVALGMARARTLQKEHYQVIALVGDGALTGGLAFEGLNNAGASGEPLIVILNDNGMSITPNVGAISRNLAKMRVRPAYLDFKLWYRDLMARLPGGHKIYQFTHRLKARVRKRLLGTTIFEDMGFTHLGPVDGHDVEKMTELLRSCVQLREPVLLHILTKKGMGFAPAEKTPQNFHGVGKFDPVSGRSMTGKTQTFSAVFGSELTALARESDKICAITAAMQHGVGLDQFAKTFPKRYFDVGIAEGHAVAMAGGLAKQGMLPVVCIYSTFLQRAYDMMLHDVALQNLHVVFAVDHTGFVGADGETHHGAFDVGFLRQIPNIRIYCPASLEELRRMLRAAIFDARGPVAIRYPAGGEGSYMGATTALRLSEGADCTIVSYGTLINCAIDAAYRCAQAGLDVEVLKLPTIAPLNLAAIAESVQKTGYLVVAEETADAGCVADTIFAYLEQQGIAARCQKRNLGGQFHPHGTIQQLRTACGLDGESLSKLMMEVMDHEA